MYPSVIALIHANHISDSDVSKIPATGPQNRLLKGDVLAYLGEIDAEYSKQQSVRIEHASHMDLSNIKVISAAEKPASAAPTLPEPPRNTSITLPISLASVLTLQSRIQDKLHISLPLSTFVARAVDFANEDLPTGPAPQTADSLFDEVLGLNTFPRGAVRVSRGSYLPSIIPAVPAASGSAARAISLRTSKMDIIDILSGKASNPKSNSRKPAAAAAKSGPQGAVNVFSLTVPVGEEKRGRIFLERMKTVLQVEPGRLVL